MKKVANSEHIEVLDISEVKNPKYSTAKKDFYEKLKYPIKVHISKTPAKFIYKL